MCGRYYRRSDKQKIAEAFHIAQVDDFVLPPWDYNVAPSTTQPVIRQNHDTYERELVALRWGLVPFFTESLAAHKSFSTINARAESIQTTRMWREPLKKRRCLVPADGFYEWLRPDKKTRIPYAFSVKGNEPFAFAGLWDAWKEPDGSWLQTFAIITTDANELMAPIHDRMPVILHPRDYDRWLDREETERPPVDLLRPYETEEMYSALANPAVGNGKNNGPEMLNSRMGVSGVANSDNERTTISDSTY